MKMNQCYGKWRDRMALLIVVMMDFFIIIVVAKSTAVVDTTSGPVRGEIVTDTRSVTYAAFKGIPYARPPLGKLRFKAPVPINRSNIILDATVEGASCPQYDGTARNDSEDCLFINIFTPVTDLRKIPKNFKSVMVWIHGGSFAFGTSSPTVYNPSYILEKDIVYVSFNYRLGALGFLSLGHSDASGNAGLKDQVLALKWVHSNIQKFGGNPKNVTIFGQSAGAASVGYHVLSDASVGLFHGAISMSGVPINPWAFQKPSKALEQAQKLGALLGANSNNTEVLLKTLYLATANEILNATSRLSSDGISFLPTVENKKIAIKPFLSECWLRKYKSGNYSKVPQILGFMDQEPLIYFGVPETFESVLDYAVNYAKIVGVRPAPDLLKAQILSKIGLTYPKMADALQKSIMNEMLSILFVNGIDETQRLLSATNDKPTYYYHVSFYDERSIHLIVDNITLVGPGHGDDHGYIFYSTALDNSTDRMRDPVARTIDRVSTMWTNFAKYGNPTPNWVKGYNTLKVRWPESGPLGISFDIGKELKSGPRPINVETTRIENESWPYIEVMTGCPIM